MRDLGLQWAIRGKPADWPNNRRLLEPIGNIPPAEAEQQFYATLDGISMDA